MQSSLFKENDQARIPNIDGLFYYPEFISKDEESNLIHLIDQQSWNHDLKRRVQHYGYRYDYKARFVTADSYLGPLPNWLQEVSSRVTKDKLFSYLPDQIIVNEYLSGQGISPHIDCIPCFGGTIASLSLGSGAVMQFSKENDKKEIYLEPRSLIFLSGPARFEWTHAIPARKSDTIDGYKKERSRRLSLTFRNMIVE